MSRIVAIMLLALLAACATTKRPPQPETLAARSYTLFVWSNCQEGVVGCDNLSGDLMPAGTRNSVRLAGSTHMIKCADGVTPCHIGHYRLTGAGFSVLAYPDGTLEVKPPAGASVTEKGDWLEF